MRKTGYWVLLLTILAAVTKLLMPVQVWPNWSDVQPKFTKAISAITSTSTLTTPAPTATPKPTPTTTAKVLALATPSYRSVTPAPTYSNSPISIHTPIPTTWTVSDCAWAEQTLQLDENLDLQGAVNYPNSSVALHQTAAQWQEMYVEAEVVCRAPGAASLIIGGQYEADYPAPPDEAIGWTSSPLTPAACSNVAAWVSSAIVGHQADEQYYPQNQAWDDQWISNYQRINGLWSEVCK